jgi:hypothetical protein
VTHEELMCLQISDRMHREKEAKRPLMDRLREVMPKRALEEAETDGLGMRQFRSRPIRMEADSFSGWLGDQLPKDKDELRAILWTFGEIISGHLEDRLNCHTKLTHDFLKSFISPSTMRKPDEPGSNSDSQQS